MIFIRYQEIPSAVSASRIYHSKQQVVYGYARQSHYQAALDSAWPKVGRMNCASIVYVEDPIGTPVNFEMIFVDGDDCKNWLIENLETEHWYEPEIEILKNRDFADMKAVCIDQNVPEYLYVKLKWT